MLAVVSTRIARGATLTSATTETLTGLSGLGDLILTCASVQSRNFTYGIAIGEGKEVRDFDGRPHIMERALHADFAFVKAWKGDKWGNLVYRKTARNFNPMMATAAKVTIAEVEELVEVGELEPDQVITPSVYVKRIFKGELFEKRIEKRTVRKAG